MKISIPLFCLLILYAAACNKAPETEDLDARLKQLESRVAKLELKTNGPPKNVPVMSDTITIYFNGAFAHPGQYELKKDITMLQALAAKGVGSQYARDITLTRAGTQFNMSTRPKFNEIILQDGDVITALQGQAIFNP